MTLDFQTKEASELMTFSVEPTVGHKPWSEEQSPSAMREGFAKQGKVDARMTKVHEMSMKVHETLFEQRNCASGFSAQTLNGIGKHLPTTQDDLPLTKRTSQQWVKSGTKLVEEEQLGALILFMDGALSFVPLMHNHQYLDDAGACSSLDFAMRLFADDVDFNQWHLHEMRTVVGSLGRTFSEAKLFNERGKLVANMTQQSIMRSKPVSKGKDKSNL
jgi:acyl-CoA thioesterase